ncbi:MAG: hypothetical protein ACI8WT_004301 [Clostridium sp.]|jgi:hypothetical protein
MNIQFVPKTIKLRLNNKAMMLPILLVMIIVVIVIIEHVVITLAFFCILV